MQKKLLFILFLVISLGALTIFGIDSVLPLKEEHLSALAYLIPLVLILLNIGSYYHKMTFALRDFSLWLVFFFLCVILYIHQDTLLEGGRILKSYINPSAGLTHNESRIEFRLNDSGHFVIDAYVEGKSTKFLLDTGATRVVLTARDAERLGINLDTLLFTQPTQTANGQTFSALITLKEIKIGPIKVYNVPASVSGGDLNQSLLGMSFLHMLKGWNVRNGVLNLEN